jgi:hypothetical protein
LNSIVGDLHVSRNNASAFQDSDAVFDEGGREFSAKVNKNLQGHTVAGTGLNICLK